MFSFCVVVPHERHEFLGKLFIISTYSYEERRSTSNAFQIGDVCSSFFTMGATRGLHPRYEYRLVNTHSNTTTVTATQESSSSADRRQGLPFRLFFCLITQLLRWIICELKLCQKPSNPIRSSHRRLTVGILTCMSVYLMDRITVTLLRRTRMDKFPRWTTMK